MIAIDPGVTTGWAFFQDNHLSVATYSSPGALFEHAFHPDPGALVLIEDPRWYPRDHTDVNDLLDLAVLVGEYKRHYQSMGAEVELVWPVQWKGTAPKEITNKRTLRALSANEVAVLPRKPRARRYPYDHNLLDAVGLGLWKLGRLP